jgi:hypothetical protein
MWRSWQEGLTVKVRLPEDLPALRMLLVLDNLRGHKNAELYGIRVNASMTLGRVRPPVVERVASHRLGLLREG